MNEYDILRKLDGISTTLATHSQESKDREKRIINHVNTKISAVEALVKKAEEKADRAHAAALEAKQHAGNISIDAEGNDHSIFAELGSLKAVLGDTNNRLLTQEKIEKQRKEDAAKERKRDIASRKRWRALSAVAIPALTVLGQKIWPDTAPHPPIKTETRAAMIDAGVPQ